MEDGSSAAEHEVWSCQDGPIVVAVDSAGCPLDSQYCKIQAGAVALAVAAGATFSITITVRNLIFAKVRGFNMEASDPAAVPLTGRLELVGVTSIDVLGNEMLTGEVPGSRFKNDSTGPGGVGTGQLYRGDLGTAGGDVVVQGINRGTVVINVWASIDITGKKSG